MPAATGHAPPYELSYYKHLQNASLAITKVVLSVSTACKSMSASETLGTVDFEVRSSRGTMPTEHLVQPIVALSTADSIVVPTQDAQGESPSAFTTSVNWIEPNAVLAISMWNKDFDTVGPTVTILEQDCSTDADVHETQSVTEPPLGPTSSPHICFGGGYYGTATHDNCTTDSRPVSMTTNHAATSSRTETQEPCTSAAFASGSSVEQQSAHAAEPGGQGDLPVVTTKAISTTATQQTPDETRYGVTYDGTIQLVTSPSVAKTTDVSNHSRTIVWDKTTGLSTGNIWTQIATNGSVSTPTTPTSAPPTFASTGHMATSRLTSVLICLWTMALIRI